MTRILMLDGDPDIVEAGRTILQREGYTVAMSPSLEGAVALLAHFQPDLVFIDVMARRSEDASHMARHLREQGYAAPILVLATVGRTVEFFTYRDGAGIVPVGDFEERPMEPAALVKNVQHLLVHSGDFAPPASVTRLSSQA